MSRYTYVKTTAFFSGKNTSCCKSVHFVMRVGGLMKIQRVRRWLIRFYDTFPWPPDYNVCTVQDTQLKIWFGIVPDNPKIVRWFIPLMVLHGKNSIWSILTSRGNPRNIHLGLAADGFNLFGNMCNPHSTWPVILTTYNLPPWLCMKESSFMLTLLIPGPKAPRKDLDVFLRPLVDELK